MAYEVEDLKKTLVHLKEDPMRTVLTEHFLEKIEHRDIDELEISRKLEDFHPKSIKKYSNANMFELEYSWNGENDLVVVLLSFPPKDVILISAFLKQKKVIG